MLILDRDGHEIGSWGNLASSPHGIWVNPAGEIYLADTGFHTITKHAPTGEVLLSIGTKGQKGPDGQPFNMPTHAVEAPNGDIFVSDGYGQNLIHHFSAKGEHLLTFGGGDSVFIPKRFNLGPVTGRPGTDPCQFNVLHELLVTADNLVYVMDRENHRWQVFTTDGTFVSLQLLLLWSLSHLIYDEGHEHLTDPHHVSLGDLDIRNRAGIRRRDLYDGPIGLDLPLCALARTRRGERPRSLLMPISCHTSMRPVRLAPRVSLKLKNLLLK